MIRILFSVFLFFVKEHETASVSPGYEQYELLSKWMLKFNIFDQQNCFAMNFGVDKEIPIPQLSMTFDLEIKQNAYVNNLHAPTNCYFVIIGGEYLHVLDEVFRKVETITKDLAMRPFMIVVETESYEVTPRFSTSVPHTLVTVYKQDFSVGTGIKLFCPEQREHPLKMMLFTHYHNNKNATFEDVCEKPRIRVTIAYNNEPRLFEFNETSQWPVLRPPNIVRYDKVQLVWDYEILLPFLKMNNLEPHWTNCNRIWGTRNRTTGIWNGATGQVQRLLINYI